MSYSKNSFIASLDKYNPEAVPIWQKFNAEKGNWYYDKDGNIKNQVALTQEEMQTILYAIKDDPWQFKINKMTSFFDDTKFVLAMFADYAELFGISADEIYPKISVRKIMGKNIEFSAEENLLLNHLHEKLSNNHCERMPSGMYKVSGCTLAMTNRYEKVAEKFNLSGVYGDDNYRYPNYYNAPLFEKNGEMLFFNENQRKFFLSLDGEVQQLEPVEHTQYNFG